MGRTTLRVLALACLLAFIVLLIYAFSVVDRAQHQAGEQPSPVPTVTETVTTIVTEEVQTPIPESCAKAYEAFVAFADSLGEETGYAGTIKLLASKFQRLVWTYDNVEAAEVQKELSDAISALGTASVNTQQFKIELDSSLESCESDLR